MHLALIDATLVLVSGAVGLVVGLVVTWIWALCSASSFMPPPSRGPMVFSNTCPRCGAVYARRVLPHEMEWAERAAGVIDPDLEHL